MRPGSNPTRKPAPPISEVLRQGDLFSAFTFEGRWLVGLQRYPELLNPVKFGENTVLIDRSGYELRIIRCFRIGVGAGLSR